jgi:hypothetical protein
LEALFILHEGKVPTRKEFEDQLNIANYSLAAQFDELTNYPKKEIQKLANDLTTKNMEKYSLIRKNQVELREINNGIFMLRVKEKIIVGPIKNYIKVWVDKVV